MAVVQHITIRKRKHNLIRSTPYSVHTVYNVHSAQEELMPKILLDLIGCMSSMYFGFISKVNHVQSINIVFALVSIK